MNKAERREYAKLMLKREKARKAKEEKLERIRQQGEQPEVPDVIEDAAEEPAVGLAKTTKLVFFRQYNTYQALLEVHSQGEMTAHAVYAKVILYVMRWFCNRLGEEVCKTNPDLAFLREDYPQPEDYEKFDPCAIADINGFDFIDFRTASVKNKKGWAVCLIEPDNGQERRDIHGRTFTTEISVYEQEKSVVLAIKESCREPEKNTEDAFGYRPGFVRDIFYDKDLVVTEQGIDREYAFAHAAYRLNGKSGEASRKIYDGLIVAEGRQMPILFVPGDYYDMHSEEVDAKADSLLGYCHVVVMQNGCRKLFEQIMEDEELVEVAEEGQLIFYRKNSLQEYPADYFQDDTDDLLDNVKMIAQHEPLRKYCDFRGFSFRPWEAAQDTSGAGEADEVIRGKDAKIAELTKQVNDLERDNDHLQRNLTALAKENKELDKEIRKNFSEISKNIRKMNDAIDERDRVRDELQKLTEKSMREKMIADGMLSETKERYIPIINLPTLSSSAKEEILEWIRQYYSDVLIIHTNAEKSFFSDSRNIDWHRFCMMIHYIAGYTRHRNEGGYAIDANAARDYDAEDSAYTIEPSSSGQGALEMYKDKYTITITEEGKAKDVLLDMHLKYGKGMDDNMIRIYFHYSPKEKKTFLGFMPGHLPIR
ncbi:MAG: hypothetical protein K6F73_08635 [Lachnospiraceae bacterium]|nr:hypothetical protein [Lachnospiraceae bacterium]